MSPPRDIVFLGLSITSSWGNGHATNYRALAKALQRRGHRVLFLERDAPWSAARRELAQSTWPELGLYRSVAESRERWDARLREADLVVLGSSVPDGRAVADWVLSSARGATAFYDLDTPRTMGMLVGDACEYLEAAQVPRFDYYLSSSGGELLDGLALRFGARRPRALYCCVDPDVHQPLGEAPELDLGYLGTYSDDRQPALAQLLLEPARRRPRARFAVAGSRYPETLEWPPNVERSEHLPPDAHARFYGRQRFTLNVTRRDMVSAGWSPSVRMFEAAACCVPTISDLWPGLGDLFRIGEEVLVAREAREVLALLDGLPERRRQQIARAARARVLAEHTADHRAVELEQHLAGLRRSRGRVVAWAGSSA